MNDSLILPDGRRFELWEQPASHHKTYHVAQRHESADDNNPGTAEAPFRTIQAAADRVEPGQRVLIHAGIYRETVRPRRGGTGPTQMVTFQAVPGEEVVITGAEPYRGPWELNSRWDAVWKSKTEKPDQDDPKSMAVYHLQLPREWFVGYLPFGMPNFPQHHTFWGRDITNFPDELRWKLMLKRGLIFQDGRRLKQVSRPHELADEPGTYWCEDTGLDLLVRPFGAADPAESDWQLTVREQGFAPEAKGLEYVRVSGLTIRHVADPWTWPQRAALSASHGRYWIIEDCHVHDVNASGIDIGREHTNLTGDGDNGFQVIRGNRIERAGLTGLTGWAPKMTDLLVEDNTISGCGWHNIERAWESAAIKLHQVHDSVFRRNLITDTKNAAGIWLDFGISNTRVTGNVILDTQTGFGGVFIEAAKEGHVLIDHNIIGGSRMVPPFAAAENADPSKGGHGVYSHDSDRLIVAHNLIYDCQGTAAHIGLGQTDRIAIVGRGAVCRDNRVLNNVVINCGKGVHFGRPHNTAEGNVYLNLTDKSVFQIGEPLENMDWTGWQEFLGFDRHGDNIQSDQQLVENLNDDSLQVALPFDLPRVPSIFLPIDRDAHPDEEVEDTIPGPFSTPDAWLDPIELDPCHKRVAIHFHSGLSTCKLQ